MSLMPSTDEMAGFLSELEKIADAANPVPGLRLADLDALEAVLGAPAYAAKVYAGQKGRKKGEGRLSAHKRHMGNLGVAQEKLETGGARLGRQRLIRDGYIKGGLKNIGTELSMAGKTVTRKLPLFHNTTQKMDKTRKYLKGVRLKELPRSERLLQALKSKGGKRAGLALALAAAFGSGRASNSGD